MHYDDLHYEKWRARGSRGAKPTKRSSEYKVMRSAVASHQRKLCQRIEHPPEVKALYRQPKDEENWTTLQSFRTVLCGIVQGKRQLALASEEEVQDLAMAIENCTRGKEWNTVGEGFQGIPPGSELLAERPDGHDDVQIRRSLADNVRRMEVGTTVAFHTRPWDPEKRKGKKRIPIEDPFVKLLFKDERVVDVKKLARTAPRGPFDVLGLFDRMLLTLWDALHLDMAEVWAQKKVANVRASDCPELARYFLRGLDVGTAPLIEGMCSFCACLLHRHRGENGLTNMKTGPPMDKDGRRLLRADGAPDLRAQPPAFLRHRDQAKTSFLMRI